MSTGTELASASTGRDLVPGDAARLNDVAGVMQAYAADLSEAAQALSTLSTSTWTGEAADRFRTTFAPHPGRWRTAADAFAQASRALSTYATALLLAQDDASDALVRFRRGAAGAPRAVVTGVGMGVGIGLPADPGAHDRMLAVVAVDEARERVRTAGIAAHNAVRSATAGAPENPSWWQSASAVVGAVSVNGAEAIWNNALVPAINGIVTFNQASNRNPIGALSMIGGAALIVAGGIGDGAGGVACATGVGCVVGGPAIAGSTATVVTGWGLMIGGATSVGATAAANPITIVERTGKKGSASGSPPQNPSTPPRKFNVGRSQSPVWKATTRWLPQTRTNGLSGSKKEYFQWDSTHNDIEVYDSKRKHLGSMDPVTGAMIKPPVVGREMTPK